MRKSIAFECLLIGLSCVLIYLANDRSSAAGDTWSNSQLAFNWLLDNTLHFDGFRNVFVDRNLPHALTEASNGHLTSSYPIGPAIITFPLYFVFSVYLNFIDWLYQISSHSSILGMSIGSDIPHVTESDFDTYRAVFAKLVLPYLLLYPL